MVRIAICEDDMVCRKEAERYIVEVSGEIQVKNFSNGETFCHSIQKDGMNFDIVFMDIELGKGKMNGIEAARWLRERSHFDTTMIIFMTGHTELAEETFSVIPFYFLQKPLDPVKLKQVLQWAIERLNEGRQYFAYRRYNTVYRIPINTIYYFRGDSRAVYLADARGSERIVGKMKQVEGELKQMNATCFCKISKKCIINLEHVEHFGPQSVRMSDGTELPVNSEYRAVLQRKIGQRTF